MAKKTGRLEDQTAVLSDVIRANVGDFEAVGAALARTMTALGYTRNPVAPSKIPPMSLEEFNALPVRHETSERMYDIMYEARKIGQYVAWSDYPEGYKLLPGESFCDGSYRYVEPEAAEGEAY